MATTRTRRKTTQTTVEKAQVGVVAPGKVSANIRVLGLTPTGETLYIDRSRRGRYATFYEMYRQHPTVRAAIEKVARVAVVNGYRFMPAEVGEEVPKEKVRDLNLFFRKSNGSQLLRVSYKDLLIYGEAFWLVIKSGNGKPISARRLHPMYMDEQMSSGEIAKWRYGPHGPSEDAIEYDVEDIVQFKFDDPDNDVRGLSLLTSLELTVASDLFAMKFNEKFFENSAHTGIIFNMKNSTFDEAQRNREYLEQVYAGVENAHRPMVLEGDVTVEKSVSTRQEMQFIEGRKFNRQEILSVLDVDPSKIGITEDSNRSSSKEADNTFRQENIAPLQLIVEEEINNALILGMFKWDDVLFGQNDASRRDLLESMKLFAEAERIGAMSVNQVKGELGFPPISGGDVHFIQTAAGAIPVEWLDDVAKRLIAPTGQPISGQGTENQPPGEPQSGSGAPAPESAGAKRVRGPGAPERNRE
jgi:HK97 family phage portal protein